MTSKKKWRLLLLVLLAVLAVGTAVYAHSGTATGYTIARSVVAGGGHGPVTGGSYALAGTAGQTAAGNAVSGGAYSLTSGFWVSFGQHEVYLPAIIKP